MEFTSATLRKRQQTPIHVSVQVLGNSADPIGISGSRKTMPHRRTLQKGLEMIEKALRELQAARSISANTLLKAAPVPKAPTRPSEPRTSIIPQTAKESR